MKINNPVTYYALAVSFLLLSSCTDETAAYHPSGEGAALRLHIVQAESIETKGPKDAFLSGDQVGVSLLNNDGTLYDNDECSRNALYIYNGSTWDTQSAAVVNEKAALVYAYYPYKAAENPVDGITIEHTSQTDYLASQGQTADEKSPEQTIVTYHLLSKLRFRLEKNRGDGWVYPGEGKITRVEVDRLDASGQSVIRSSAVYDLKNKTYRENAGTGIAKWEGSTTGDVEILVSYNTRPSSADAVARLVIDGLPYSVSLPVKETSSASYWLPGALYTYTLTICDDKTAAVTNVLITDWIETPLNGNERPNGY